MSTSLFVLSNPVFSGYAFYSAIIIAKLFLMAFLTVVQRFAHGAFLNPEDQGKSKVNINENVERVRRNHLNDIENIPAYLFLGLLYVAVGPSPTVALWHFRVFVGSRILHTVSYQLGLQPWRLLTFLAGLGVCISMLVQIISATIL